MEQRRDERPSCNNSDKGVRVLRETDVSSLGPNGHPVGYTENGDYVEWIPNEEDEGGEPWPMILRRNDNDVKKARGELRDKVWWHRHQLWLEQLRAGTNDHPSWKRYSKLLVELADKEPDTVMAAKGLPKSLREILAQAKMAARRVEEKYGRENLENEDYVLLCGRMEALAWVGGMEWDEAGGT
jgi:hypothetical protein